MTIKTALVVDDSKSARFSLRKKLEKFNLEVDFAESAQEALDSLGGKQPDIIFMDHLMPGMDGFQATKEIKKNSAWSSIPIVMCTSKEGEEYSIEAKAHGAIDILPKPASQNQIASVLENLDGSTSAQNTGAATSQTHTTAQPIQTQPVITDASRVIIDNLARDAATQVAQGLVKAMLEESLPAARKEILSSANESASSSAEKQMAALMPKLQKEILKAASEQTNNLVNEISQGLVDQCVDSKIKPIQQSLSQEFNDKLNNQLKELTNKIERQQASIQSMEKALNETRASIQTAKPGISTEDLMKKAEEQASNTAEEAAQRSAIEIADKLASETQASLKSVKTMVIGAGITAVLSLVLSVVL